MPKPSYLEGLKYILAHQNDEANEASLITFLAALFGYLPAEVLADLSALKRIQKRDSQ